MSTVLYSASGSGGSEAAVQSTTVGGSKPLHRFIKGQPKIVGIILLVLGVSYLIISTAISGTFAGRHPWTAIPPGFVLGSLFIICGILFILAEHKPTKKTVTASLALSIVTILGAAWSLLHMIPNLVHGYYFRHYSGDSSETDHRYWRRHCEIMGFTVATIFTFYNSVCIIIFIVMSSFAGAALRSPKSQAVVVMTAAPTETPAEGRARQEDLKCEI